MVIRVAYLSPEAGFGMDFLILSEQLVVTGRGKSKTRNTFFCLHLRELSAPQNRAHLLSESNRNSGGFGKQLGSTRAFQVVLPEMDSLGCWENS